MTIFGEGKATELGSIIENVGKLGAPVPKWLQKMIKQFRSKVDSAAMPEDMAENNE